MYPLVESLKLKDGVIQNLEHHQSRMNRSMDERFPDAEKIDLVVAISIPKHFNSGVFKVRVLYGQSVRKIEIEQYTYRTIQSLKVVRHESIDYHLKTTDRQVLQELFGRRGNCDDIIIIKNGMVTDSFSANLLFYAEGKWYTPTTPLLKGTKRQLLLDRGIISEKEIREEDISGFQKVGLINAMIDFEEMPVIAVEQVCF
jgi:4-amino-4-deoxychorismate lyase